LATMHEETMLRLKRILKRNLKKPSTEAICKTIGNMEPAEIIRLYVEEELSIEKIARQLSRSSKSVHDHLIKCDSSIDCLSYYPLCGRAKDFNVHYIYL